MTGKKLTNKMRTLGNLGCQRTIPGNAVNTKKECRRSVCCVTDLRHPAIHHMMLRTRIVAGLIDDDHFTRLNKGVIAGLQPDRV